MIDILRTDALVVNSFIQKPPHISDERAKWTAQSADYLTQKSDLMRLLNTALVCLRITIYRVNYYVI